MSLERKRQRMQLLEQALDHPPGDRRPFLESVCDDQSLVNEVVGLLGGVDETGILGRPIFDVHDRDPRLGQTFDGYRLIEVLGRGGMGTVFLAEHQDFEHRVALKIIRRGMDLDEILLRRFHNERQILARLDHPNIARLLGGGTTSDQLPYFVLEQIEGEPIDSYCRRQGLSLRERLGLLRKVCSAVQFAHQNLVVHRDLKPGNILVTADGEPKLLDFGIAKLLDDSLAHAPLHTDTGESPMTPRYASPEQLNLEPVTTASDVYMLGVVLYELLTGLDPYGLQRSTPKDEVIKRVREHEPDRPSTAVRQRADERLSTETLGSELLRHDLVGDLDCIVLQALRKDPGERYITVDQFSEDLGNYLTGLPVEARASTWRYRAGKFTRRHRAPIGITAAFLLVLTGFSVLSTVLWLDAIVARELAIEEGELTKEEKDRSDEVLDFVKELFREMDLEAGGSELLALDLLLRGKDKVLKEEMEAENHEEIAATMAEMLIDAGMPAEGLPLQELALDLAESRYTEAQNSQGDLSPAGLNLVKRITNVAHVHYLLEQFTLAESKFRRALEIDEQVRTNHSLPIRTMSGLATVLTSLGKLEQALLLHRQVLTYRKSLTTDQQEPDHRNLGTSYHNVAAVLYALGFFTEAEENINLAINHRLTKSLLAPYLASSRDLLGRILLAQNQVGPAQGQLQKALEIRKDHLVDGHPAIATTKRHLAEALWLSGKAEEAGQLLDDALLTFRSKNRASKVSDAESLLGTMLAAKGRTEEAHKLLRSSCEKLYVLRGDQTTTQRARTRLLDFERAGLGSPSDEPGYCQADVATESP